MCDVSRDICWSVFVYDVCVFGWQKACTQYDNVPHIFSSNARDGWKLVLCHGLTQHTTASHNFVWWFVWVYYILLVLKQTNSMLSLEQTYVVRNGSGILIYRRRRLRAPHTHNMIHYCQWTNNRGHFLFYSSDMFQCFHLLRSFLLGGLNIKRLSYLSMVIIIIFYAHLYNEWKRINQIVKLWRYFTLINSA